jgi:hypothetical protein
MKMTRVGSAHVAETDESDFLSAQSVSHAAC